jgi:enamine deaminase RidA (YjgF/YER057c/UK114 family)
MRKLVSSGSPFEPRIGFSRAVRVGRIVAVSGTAPIARDGGVAAPGDVYGQTKRCLEIIAQAIADAGLSLGAVIRTRVMLTDISRWEAAARVHGEFFGDIKPANTFVEVKGFINRDWLVEVEADCVAETDA